jgi:hypothetical protein
VSAQGQKSSTFAAFVVGKNDPQWRSITRLSLPGAVDVARIAVRLIRRDELGFVEAARTIRPGRTPSTFGIPLTVLMLTAQEGCLAINTAGPLNTRSVKAARPLRSRMCVS